MLAIEFNDRKSQSGPSATTFEELAQQFLIFRARELERIAGRNHGQDGNAPPIFDEEPP